MKVGNYRSKEIQNIYWSKDASNYFNMLNVTKIINIPFLTNS